MSALNGLKALYEFMKTDVIGYKGGLVTRDNYEKAIRPRLLGALQEAIKKLEMEENQ